MKELSDEYWMNIALEEAQTAFAEDEIPIGAVLVCNDKLIARAHNSTQRLNSPLAHAEKLVIELAQQELGKWLCDCRLYITLEPCAMCAGAIILSRIKSVIFGTFDEKNGACGSLYNLLSDRRFNHNPEVKSGIFAKESSELLKRFFNEKRISTTCLFTLRPDEIGTTENGR
ncbi:MAG: nucleoside deaminase [Candidatus Cloacimonadota bacterium]|nr:nucleoside deaminase [Candidatus Cloacimonadota bacterium]